MSPRPGVSLAAGVCASAGLAVMKPIASATVEAAKKYALRFIAILPNLVCFRQSFAGCRQPVPGRLIHLSLHYYPVHTSFVRKFIIVGRPQIGRASCRERVCKYV